MNKAHYLKLANYNIWANNLVFGWLAQLTEDQWKQSVVSSFNSIAETALHIASAEMVWYQRWNNIANPVFLQHEFKGSKDELIDIWKRTSSDIQLYILGMEEEGFNKLFHFKRTTGEEFQFEFGDSLSHVFNHSTFHRGQLVTMLRQVGFTDVSSTDMVTYFRTLS